MITIRELLNRIRWDREFSRGEFTIGYYNRLAGGVIRVPRDQVRFDPDDRFSFQLIDAAGEPLSIPLHRVCEVYRNDELIWHRARCHAGSKGRPIGRLTTLHERKKGERHDWSISANHIKNNQRESAVGGQGLS